MIDYIKEKLNKSKLLQDLSFNEICERSQLSRPTINGIFNATQECKINTLFQVVNALNCNVVISGVRMQNTESVIKRIKDIRESKNLSLNDVMKGTNIRVDVLRKLENGSVKLTTKRLNILLDYYDHYFCIEI